MTQPQPPAPQPAPPAPQQPAPGPPQQQAPVPPVPAAPMQYPPQAPAPVPPVPAAPMQYPPQVPAPQQPVQYPPQPGQQQPATGTDRGFPENTPVDQMTPQQQVEYWRTQARKHEQRVKDRADYDDLKAKATQYDQLAASTQTDHQRAIADAAATARTKALEEAGGRLVDGWVRAAALNRLDDERVNALLSGLDRRAFVNAATGEVDADKVTAYVHSVLPAPAPVYQVAPAAPGQQPVMGTPPGYAAPAPGQPGYAAPPPGQQPVYGQPAPGQPVHGQPMYPGAPATWVYPAAPYPQAGYATPGMVPGQVPEFGQGHPQTAAPSGLAAGKAVAAQRFGDQARSAGGPQKAAPPAQS